MACPALGLASSLPPPCPLMGHNYLQQRHLSLTAWGWLQDQLSCSQAATSPDLTPVGLKGQGGEVATMGCTVLLGKWVGQDPTGPGSPRPSATSQVRPRPRLPPSLQALLVVTDKFPSPPPGKCMCQELGV